MNRQVAKLITLNISLFASGAAFATAAQEAGTDVVTGLSNVGPGLVIIAVAVALLGIDWAVGLPLFWKIWEGPFVIALGLVLLTLARQIKPYMMNE